MFPKIPQINVATQDAKQVDDAAYWYGMPEIASTCGLSKTMYASVKKPTVPPRSSVENDDPRSVI